MSETVETTVVKTFEVRRQLYPGERLCDTCGGFGVVEGTDPRGRGLTFCHDCIGGIRQTCRFCEQVLKPGQVCTCLDAVESRTELHHKTHESRWAQAKKMPWSEAKMKFKWVYIESEGRFEEVETLEANLVEHHLKFPMWVYGTTQMELTLDARNIVEEGCNELHEEATNSISSTQMEQLQFFLENWCDNVKDSTRTYFPDYTIGVVMDEPDGH